MYHVRLVLSQHCYCITEVSHGLPEFTILWTCYLTPETVFWMFSFFTKITEIYGQTCQLGSNELSTI